MDNKVLNALINNLQVNSLNCKLLYKSSFLKRKRNMGNKNSCLIKDQVKINNENVKNNEKNKNLKNNNDIFIPNGNDSLFEIFNKVINNEVGNFLKDMNNKINYVYEIRNNIKLLKEYKLKKIVEDIENNLANNNENITFKTFFALCILHKLNFLCLYKHSFFEFSLDDNIDNKTYHIIHYNYETQKYYYEYCNDILKYNNLKLNRIQMDSFNKHIKCIGNYTKPELIIICKSLLIDNSFYDKKTKNDIYQLLVDKYFNNIIS
jgi:hypothetical protein